MEICLAIVKIFTFFLYFFMKSVNFDFYGGQEGHFKQLTSVLHFLAIPESAQVVLPRGLTHIQIRQTSCLSTQSFSSFLMSSPPSPKVERERERRKYRAWKISKIFKAPKKGGKILHGRSIILPRIFCSHFPLRNGLHCS